MSLFHLQYCNETFGVRTLINQYLLQQKMKCQDISKHSKISSFSQSRQWICSNEICAVLETKTSRKPQTVHRNLKLGYLVVMF